MTNRLPGESLYREFAELAYKPGNWRNSFAVATTKSEKIAWAELESRYLSPEDDLPNEPDPCVICGQVDNTFYVGTGTPGIVKRVCQACAPGVIESAIVLTTQRKE